MEKLELKHLAPYLPYGLKMIAPHSRRKGGFYHSPILLKSHNISYAIRYKPILHPLSDLIKEIEVGGERIVPIVELAKISDSDFLKIDSLKSNYGLFGVKYYDTDDNICVFAYHSNNHSFAESYFSENIISISLHQLELFQKLFEWHFDVFGLIENGLAIDANSLKD